MGPDTQYHRSSLFGIYKFLFLRGQGFHDDPKPFPSRSVKPPSNSIRIVATTFSHQPSPVERDGCHACGIEVMYSQKPTPLKDVLQMAGPDAGLFGARVEGKSITLEHGKPLSFQPQSDEKRVFLAQLVAATSGLRTCSLMWECKAPSLWWVSCFNSINHVFPKFSKRKNLLLFQASTPFRLEKTLAWAASITKLKPRSKVEYRPRAN